MNNEEMFQTILNRMDFRHNNMCMKENDLRKENIL